jgi:hypothetical protein
MKPQLSQFEHVRFRTTARGDQFSGEIAPFVVADAFRVGGKRMIAVEPAM